MKEMIEKDKELPAIPFTTNWNINSNMTEEDLEKLLADLYNNYKAWDIELTKQFPELIYETRKDYLQNSSPGEKLQREINEIQLTLWHRIIGMRSKKYSSKDNANTIMYLLLLKTNPVKNPKEKEYLRF